jgi:hypothetical protein
MRRSRAPSNWPGPFFAARSWAGCTTNMFGFDLRQAQPSAPPLKVRVTDIPMRSPGEIVRHFVTGEIVGDVDIPGISAVDSIVQCALQNLFGRNRMTEAPASELE